MRQGAEALIAAMEATRPAGLRVLGDATADETNQTSTPVDTSQTSTYTE